MTAPSANRYFNWTAATKNFLPGDTSTIVAADKPSYEMLVYLKALAKEMYVKPIRGEGGNELYHVFLSPQGMATLKLDPEFLLNVRHAQQRSKENPLFSGTAAFNSVFVDNLAIHEHRHVYNTRGLTPTNKWGASGNVDGNRMAFCGSQALAMGDIGPGFWEEEKFDYKNQPGISYGKIFGFLKPVFRTQYQATPAEEDFGIINVNIAIAT